MTTAALPENAGMGNAYTIIRSPLLNVFKTSAKNVITTLSALLECAGRTSASIGESLQLENASLSSPNVVLVAKAPSVPPANAGMGSASTESMHLSQNASHQNVLSVLTVTLV